MIEHSEICKLYDLNSAKLGQSLDNYQTHYPDRMTFNEFMFFLKNPREVQAMGQLPAEFLDNLYTDLEYSTYANRRQKTETVNLLKPEIMSVIYGIFQDIDQEQDYLINTKGFLQAILAHEKMLKHHDLPAVYLPKLDRSISLLQLVGMIEYKPEEFTSWDNFVNYFDNLSKMLTSPI